MSDRDILSIAQMYQQYRHEVGHSFKGFEDSALHKSRDLSLINEVSSSALTLVTIPIALEDTPNLSHYFHSKPLLDLKQIDIQNHFCS
jgi:hypothetical protein